MRRDIAKTILLTGAGFTRNFGGFLAREMWSKIFNSPWLRSHGRIKTLMHEEPDYESVYHTVMTKPDYQPEEKEAIGQAVFEAYLGLDNTVRDHVYPSTMYPVNLYGINRMIDCFAGDQEEMGFFFTLNHDVFVERRFSGDRAHLSLPGVRKVPQPSHGRQLTTDDFFRLPEEEELERLRDSEIPPLATSNLNYIKLHGSFNWFSCHDGSRRMVIGRDKEEQVWSEPLLCWYHKIFSEILWQGNRKLLCIGYSLRDRHINETIATAIAENGLKLHVIDTESHDKFLHALRDDEKIHRGKDLLKGLDGYYPYELARIFPGSGEETQEWMTLKQNLFS